MSSRLVHVGTILVLWGVVSTQARSDELTNSCRVSDEANSFRGKMISQLPAEQEEMFTKIMQLSNAMSYNANFLARGPSIPTAETGRVEIIIGEDDRTIVGIWCDVLPSH
jgi:hypothetical protein